MIKHDWGKTSIQRMVIALMVIGLFVGSSPVHVTANGPKILEFETMVGVPAGLTGAQQRPIHGVNGAGRPWVIGAAKGELTLTGKLELEVGQVEFALISKPLVWQVYKF